MFLKKPLSALPVFAFVTTAVPARDFQPADVRPLDYPMAITVITYFPGFSLWIPTLLKGALVY